MMNSLALHSLVPVLTFLKQLWVDFDEDFESVVDHAVNSSGYI
jgi:hypothetical protein